MLRCWSNIMAFPLSWLFSHLRSRENSHTLGIFDEGQVNVPLLNFNVHCAYYYSTSGHLCDYPDCHWTLSWSGMSDLSVGDMENLWISVIGDISLIWPIFWYTHPWVKSKICSQPKPKNRRYENKNIAHGWSWSSWSSSWSPSEDGVVAICGTRPLRLLIIALGN